MEKEDERCCGTGHCMINADGQCWCGQQWDGEKMCMPAPKSASNSPSTSQSDSPSNSASKASETSE